MSSITERLTRDIAAVSGGVVVTESDLREARHAVQERLEFRRRQHRRRTAVAIAAGLAAAVLLAVLGFEDLGALGGDADSAPPAGPGPTRGVDPDTDFLTGNAPTSELLQGVWRVDNGTVHLRFWPPNFVSFDDSGRLFHNPSVEGTYVIEGDLITVNVPGGSATCAGQTFAMRASLVEPGLAHVVHTRPGRGSCSHEPNERWTLEQVLPTWKGMAELEYSSEPGWKPASDVETLYGVWVAEGGGHVLEIDPGGSYYVADETRQPIDRGRWSLHGSELALTSSSGSSGCDQGDRLVWSELEQVNPNTTAMRGTVSKNSCGGAWASKTWILVPDAGS